MALDVVLIFALALLGAVTIYLFQRRRRHAELDPDEETTSRRRGKVELDIVDGWPPQATRLLTDGERSAQEILARALPECKVFAQVPLARFVRVPRRNSYTEWLTRVGHVAADLLVCDRATAVLGVVMLKSIRESERADRRRQRVARVLKAAGIKTFVWLEDALPGAEAARDQFLQRVGEERVTPATLPGEPPSSLTPSSLPPKGGQPPSEADSDGDGQRREPPPSTWFDDLDSGNVPLDAPRQTNTH